ncbi:MAG: hypothetical protein LWY06_11560 [Firmicutes bacterium]|nr:hypothetical protein [Bacillota bacterium]
MTEQAPVQKLNIVFIYEDTEKAQALIDGLSKKLNDYGLTGSVNVMAKSFRNKVIAALNLKQLKPAIVVIQSKMWNNQVEGFEMLEYCHKTITQENPFYSIIHGAGLDETRKQWSLKIHHIDSYHLGTCSIERGADELLLTKIVGILMQIEDYVMFHHLETPTLNTAKDLIKAILETLSPLKLAITKFQTGEGSAFIGTEKFMLTLDQEITAVRTYYNELFNLEIERRQFGKSNATVQISRTDVSLDRVFSDVSIFLTEARSPLVQLSTMMKTIDPHTKHFYEIYQYLETRIGDSRIINFCRDFLTQYAHFEANLGHIERFLGEKV